MAFLFLGLLKEMLRQLRQRLRRKMRRDRVILQLRAELISDFFVDIIDGFLARKHGRPFDWFYLLAQHGAGLKFDSCERVRHIYVAFMDHEILHEQESAETVTRRAFLRTSLAGGAALLAQGPAFILGAAPPVSEVRRIARRVTVSADSCSCKIS